MGQHKSQQPVGHSFFSNSTSTSTESRMAQQLILPSSVRGGRRGQTLSWDVAHQGCPCAQLPVRAAQVCLCAQQWGQGSEEGCEVKYTAHLKHSSHSLLCPGTAFTRPWQRVGFFAQSGAWQGVGFFAQSGPYPAE